MLSPHKMAPNFISYILIAIVIAAGANAQKNQCHRGYFWNVDVGECVSCSMCKEFPKTPSCETCESLDDTSDVWKLTAITSVSTLAVLLVSGILLVGVLVHRYRSRRKGTLRGPIEETAGPLYEA